MMKEEKPPDDAKKLRISETAWRVLVTKLRVSPAFTFALCRYFLPTGKGKRILLGPGNNILHEFWYFLPVRMQVSCTNPESSHIDDFGGNNQGNPAYYLHLPDYRVDIRGAQIAIYFQYNTKSKSARSISVNMIDGRWPKVVEEPQTRIEEALKQNVSNVRNDPFFMHIIYFTSALKWWTNALAAINLQLISWVGQRHGQLKIITPA
jgi:hypothetical protein